MCNMNEKKSTFVGKQFPMDVLSVPFTRYSHFPTNVTDADNRVSPKRQRAIIIGGDNKNETNFYEFYRHGNTNPLNCKYIELLTYVIKLL